MIHTIPGWLKDLTLLAKWVFGITGLVVLAIEIPFAVGSIQIYKRTVEDQSAKELHFRIARINMRNDKNAVICSGILAFLGIIILVTPAQDISYARALFNIFAIAIIEFGLVYCVRNRVKNLNDTPDKIKPKFGLLSIYRRHHS